MLEHGNRIPTPTSKRQYMGDLEAARRSGTADKKAGRKRYDKTTPLTSSAAGSHVSPSPSQASSWDETMIAGSGRSSHESFASYDPASSSWRTCQACLFEEWATYSETFPPSGTMQNGKLYRRQPLERRTSDGESGLLPTPTKESYGTSQNGQRADGTTFKQAGKPGLDTMARRGLWPTPTVQDKAGHNGEYEKTSTHHEGLTLATAVQKWPTPKSEPSGPDFARANRPNSGGDDLATATARENFPTPRAEDSQCAGAHRGTPDSLYSATGGTTPAGQLSPDWVEVLMGFPRGWTLTGKQACHELRREFLTVLHAYAVSGTQSCPK